MSTLLASRLAQKSLQMSSPSRFIRNLVPLHSPKSCPAARPSTAVAPRPLVPSLVRYTSTVTPPTTWIDRFPASVRPYIYLTRVDKPIGTLLLFYPCSAHFSCFRVVLFLFFHSNAIHTPAWSITMASYAHGVPLTTSLAYLGLFGLGAFVMRGAGCTINDMWDKNLDKAVGQSSLLP